MDGLEALFANRVLWAAMLGWAIAQTFKVMLTFIVYKRWDFSRMFGSGGMPSSHSSFICALATAVAITRGFQSVEFAISFALALIVMYDAAGVRRSAGKQAAAINQIIQDMMKRGSKLTQDHLKELIGHTPFEVIMGALLGVLVAILFV
ncbi:MAG TPA: divergent PAP2 family protein [Candidatus Fimadaptatus faecigallinarum]|uniref:Divergent PAP2 family protein n=1 Tax=Candidatus Fimadaptatus faecigallinarum TaxID=2840814 RepID=A0A9D1LSG6_9FIRM|nr:divergent PAP2 family protein [Candidatus Fimadaptatus faecigallinarum]